MPESLISIPKKGSARPQCPSGYVKSSENSGYIYCSYVGAPTAAPKSGGKFGGSSSKNKVQTNVSPVINVSPQISPVFQQQFQPNNSPATAGTQQTQTTPQPAPAPAPTPEPFTPSYTENVPAPIAAPNGGGQSVPTGGGSGAPMNVPIQYSEPETIPSIEDMQPVGDFSNSGAPTGAATAPDNSKMWLILAALGVGAVMLGSGNKKKRR